MVLRSRFDDNSLADAVGIKLRPRPDRWLTPVPDAPAAPPQAPEPPRPRPGTVLDMIGQDEVRVNLLHTLRSAQLRGQPAPHCLFSGSPGLGKTSLGRLISTYMGTDMVETTPANLTDVRALAAILLDLKSGDVLFIDEGHELRRRVAVLDALDIAMEDGFICTATGRGDARRIARRPLAPFTVVVATTAPGLLPDALLRRLTFKAALSFYVPDELADIVTQAGPTEGVTVAPDAALALGQRAKGTPAVAINLLRLARDLAVSVTGKASGVVLDLETVEAAMARHHIDSLGLDHDDRAVLVALCTTYTGGPTGVGNLTCSGVDKATITGRIMPYLIKSGLVTPCSTSGVAATATAFTHLGI